MDVAPTMGYIAWLEEYARDESTTGALIPRHIVAGIVEDVARLRDELMALDNEVYVQIYLAVIASGITGISSDGKPNAIECADRHMQYLKSRLYRLSQGGE